MCVCFIGHRYIAKTKELESLLRETILDLLNKGVKTFMFGSMSEFDLLCWQVVADLKKEFPFVKRVYVRAAFQYINKSYEEYLLKYYEETYYPSKVEKAGRCSYIERNYEMIDCAKYCVFYYDKNYIPSIKKQAKHKDLLPSRRNSGTKIAYEYATKKKKEIINLYKNSETY